MPGKRVTWVFSEVQKPVALLKYDHTDVVRLVLIGLQGDLARDEMEKGHTEGTARNLSYQRVLEAWDMYQGRGRRGLKEWAERTGHERDTAALVDEREFGYVIRAVKSPLRVGDLHDPEIVTDANKAIARQMGGTTRRLLEHGYWNLSPNPGNWTTAGELVDFEDVIQVPNELHLAESDQSSRGIPSRRKHLEFTFGEGSTGLLSPQFREGFVGAPATDETVGEIADRIVARHSH